VLRNYLFENNYFDYYTISFGIRNVDNIDRALKEAYRVLKPGGRFLCLEFSKVESKILNKFYKTYSKTIPQIGKFVVGKSEPYEYLINSIEKFYSQEEFFQKIKKQNFIKISYRNLSGGIVAIHSAWKV
jgi:Methylase involved in ubiquinone/menaquinone biosynthesis